jgi:hypothetical protein
VAALRATIAALDRHVEDASRAKHQADRASRLPLLLIALALPVAPSAIAVRRRRWAGLAAAGAGVASTFAAFLLLRTAAGVRLSLSSINNEENLPGYFLGILALTGAALVAGLLVAFTVARRRDPDAPTLCRLGLIVVGGVVSALAVLATAFHWDHGLLLEWRLADIDDRFLGFVRLVQLQAVAFGALLVPPLAWGFRRLTAPRTATP